MPAPVSQKRDANAPREPLAPASSASMETAPSINDAPGLVAIDRESIRREVLARTSASAQPQASLTAGILEEGEKLAASQQGRVRGFADAASAIRSGQERMRNELLDGVRAHEASWQGYNPFSYRFWEGKVIQQMRQEAAALGAFSEGLALHEQGLRESLASSERHLSVSGAAYRESQALRAEADRALQVAREAATQRDERTAQEQAERARELTIKSLERLKDAQVMQQEAIRALPTGKNLASLPPDATKTYMESLKAGEERLAALDKGLRDTEQYIRLARNATIVVGATVATGGLATAASVSAYGVVGAGAIAIAGGTGTGTGIGLLSAAAEQSRATLEGSKAAPEALRAAAVQVGQDAQVALTSSVTTATTVAGLAAVAPRLAVMLGGSRAAQVGSKMLVGGGASLPGGALQEGFDATVNGGSTGSALEVAGRLAKGVLLSSVGTMVGTAGRSLRNGSTIRGGLVLAGEAAVDAGVSVGVEAADAAIWGKEFSSADAVRSFQQSLIGTFSGELNGAARAQGTALKNPTGTAGTASPAPSPKGIAYHKNLDSVRKAFVRDAVKEVQDSKGRPPTPEESKIILNEARTMRAYENPRTGIIHAIKPDPTVSPAERVAATSDLVHELSHRRGGDEVAAHRAQIEFIEKNGFEVTLQGDVMRVSPAGPGGPRTPSSDQVNDFIERTHPRPYKPSEIHAASGTLAVRPEVKQQSRTVAHLDAQIAATVRDLPASEGTTRIQKLLSENNVKEALAEASRLEAKLVEDLRSLTDGAFEHADRLGQLKGLLEQHPSAYVSPKLAVALPSESHLATPASQVEQFLVKFNGEPTVKAKVRQFLEDVASVKSRDQLQKLTGNVDTPSEVRSLYGIQKRFHQHGAPVGQREVWTLEIRGGQRVIVGFDNGTGAHQLVYSERANPHRNERDYLPEVEASIRRFLEGR